MEADGIPREGSSDRVVLVRTHRGRPGLLRRLRWVVPGVLLLTFAWVLWRGTQVQTFVTPAIPADGTVVALVQDETGRKVLEGGRVLPFPQARVWQVLLRSSPKPGEGSKDPAPSFLDEVLPLPARDLPLPPDVQVVEGPRPSLSWSAPGGTFGVHRGRWTLESLGTDRTRVTLMLDADIRSCPLFLTRAFLRPRMATMLERLDETIGRAP